MMIRCACPVRNSEGIITHIIHVKWREKNKRYTFYVERSICSDLVYNGYIQRKDRSRILGIAVKRGSDYSFEPLGETA